MKNYVLNTDRFPTYVQPGYWKAVVKYYDENIDFPICIIEYFVKVESDKIIST